jgi:hypothetical protein
MNVDALSEVFGGEIADVMGDVSAEQHEMLKDLLE